MPPVPPMGGHGPTTCPPPGCLPIDPALILPLTVVVAGVLAVLVALLVIACRRPPRQ